MMGRRRSHQYQKKIVFDHPVLTDASFEPSTPPVDPRPLPPPPRPQPIDEADEESPASGLPIIVVDGSAMDDASNAVILPEPQEKRKKRRKKAQHAAEATPVPAPTPPSPPTPPVLEDIDSDADSKASVFKRRRSWFKWPRFMSGRPSMSEPMPPVASIDPDDAVKSSLELEPPLLHKIDASEEKEDQPSSASDDLPNPEPESEPEPEPEPEPELPSPSKMESAAPGAGEELPLDMGATPQPPKPSQPARKSRLSSAAPPPPPQASSAPPPRPPAAAPVGAPGSPASQSAPSPPQPVVSPAPPPPKPVVPPPPPAAPPTPLPAADTSEPLWTAPEASSSNETPETSAPPKPPTKKASFSSLIPSKKAGRKHSLPTSSPAATKPQRLEVEPGFVDRLKRTLMKRADKSSHKVPVQEWPNGHVIRKQYVMGDIIQLYGVFILRKGIDITNEGRPLAIKFHAGRERFQREVRAMLFLKHDHICPLVSMFTDDPEEDWYPFSVTIMELGDVSLMAYSEQHRPWNMERFKEIFKQVVEALKFIKQKGFVHGNMRPASIIYFRDKTWKLSNFDVCAPVGELMIPYFLNYNGPEVARAMRDQVQLRASHTIDLFALGRTIQETLVGADASSFYPGLSEDESTLGFLARINFLEHGTTPLFKHEQVEDAPTRAILRGLLQREPMARVSLKRVEQYLNYTAKDPADSSEYAWSEDATATLMDEEAEGMRFDPACLVEKQIIAGIYRLESQAGKGGSGLVWRVTDVDTQGLYALKFYSDASMFDREVSILQDLQHPNVIDLVDAFERDEESDWYPYSVAVMGCGLYSLQEHARYQRPMRLTKIKLIMEAVIAGLQVCHMDDIVHADLKPDNIMFFRDADDVERWKLIDFDSACYVGDVLPRGTIDYCAPEVIRALHQGKQPVADLPVDLFAIGRVLQWLSTPEGGLWPGLDDMAVQSEKESILASDDEMPLRAADLPHTATRNLVRSLLVKDASKRLTLSKLMASSFLRMDMDTTTLRAARRLVRSSSREAL